MKLKELDIRRLPGIDARFLLRADDIGSRVTVIHGPNATGKSSLCRAVRALLWPELETTRDLDLAARFEHDARNLSVERQATHVGWSHDGAPAVSPDIPPVHLASCYTIDGDDLVARPDDASPAARDAALAAEIARQMSGGFDLRAIAKAKDTQRAGQHEARKLNDARESQRATYDAHRALDHERAKLADLAQRTERARAAQAEIHTIQTARELAAVRERVRELSIALRAYPSGMESLLGNERTRLDAVGKKITEARAALEACDRDIERSSAALAAIGLPAEGLDAGRLEESRRHLALIERMDLELVRLERDHAAALMSLEERRRILHPVSVPRTDMQSLAHAEAFLRRSEALAHERAELDAKLALLPKAPPDGDRDAFNTGARLLTQWLSSSDPRSKGSEISRWILLMLVACAAIVLAFQVHIAWIALALVAASVEIALRARGGRQEDARGAHQEEFARLGLELPAEWTREAVARRVDELARERAEFELAAAEQGRRLDLERAAVSLDARVAELDRARDALGHSLGIDFSGADIALSVVAQNVIAFHAHHNEAVERAARFEHERAVQNGRISELGSWVSLLGAPGGTDAAALAGAIESLAERASAHVRERGFLDSAMERRAHTVRELAAHEAEHSGLLASAGNEVELERRLELWPEWKRLWKELEHARARERELATKLEHEPELAHASLAECAAALERAEHLAAEHADLIRTTQDIETRIAEASKKHDLEEAMALVEEAKDALRRRRETALDDAATIWLVERIERESRATAQSPVFKRAAAWFAKFTHHAFELELTPGQTGAPPAFSARDTSANKRRALSELSSGTRAQLLLAARIAFATEAERGVRLPIFLDEALAKSDPERFASVASSLALLAREDDRQVIYLTSDPAEIDLWKRAVPENELAVVDLSRVRGMQAGADERVFHRPADAGPPAPAGRTAAEYARALMVPRIDPHASVDGIHLFYLIDDDLALLHSLLCIRVDTLGKLRSLARTAEWRAYLSADAMQRIDSCAAVFEATVQAWRIGRGLPLRRDVLESAGVSEKYLDNLWAIAGEVGNDGKRLIAILVARSDPRIRGWREAKTSELEDHLAEHGYFDRRDPLAEADVLARALEAAAPAVGAGSLAPLEVPRRVSWWLALFASDGAQAMVSPEVSAGASSAEPTEARRT